MSVFEIPMNGKAQEFSITLAGVQYNLTLVWNSVSSAWIMDIADSNDDPLLSGVPIVTGADILAQFEYIGISGELYVQTDSDPNVMPTYENFGTDSHLYFATE